MAQFGKRALLEHDDADGQVQLSEEDIRRLLHAMGQLAVLMAVMFLIYGIYFAFTLLSSFVLISRGIRNSKPRLILFIIAVIEFLISTSYIILVLVFNAFVLLDITSQSYHHWTYMSMQFGIGIDFLTRLNFLLSDGIAVWRTWVLFPYNRIVKMSLVICMVVSAICTFISAGINTAKSLQTEDGLYSEPSTLTLLISLPLLITNLIATSLIGYKTWSHRQDVKRNLMASDTAMTKVNKVLLLLVESGVIYCAIWVAYIVTQLSGMETNGSFSALIFTSVTPLLAALFPVVVVLMASLEDPDNRSWNPNGENNSWLNNFKIRSFSLTMSMRAASVNASRRANTLDSTGSGAGGGIGAGAGSYGQLENDHDSYKGQGKDTVRVDRRGRPRPISVTIPLLSRSRAREPSISGSDQYDGVIVVEEPTEDSEESMMENPKIPESPMGWKERKTL
ncbi:hypothetical protein D9758_011819 [Tetrapyrgos nigripes]|uniref:Uncharacterized protein n=1 Tax=Tetrapyrgos nigripes TaxID=182062 RepID=A0A8H5FNW7_9AGAR|nr:hypothetical protein D9758_011819 [Tetrapyrgos nigripes]